MASTRLINIREVLIAYAIELLILVALSLIGFYVGPYFISRSLMNELKNELTSAVNLGPNYIFLHNLTIDTLMAIPIIGPFVFIFSLASTGVVLGVYVAYAVDSPIVLLLAILITLFLPHGIIELLAYAFSITGSTILTVRLVRAIRGRGSISSRDVISLLVYYAISVVLLYVAANVEYLEIIKLGSLIKSLIS